jgi:hypothetical protein
LSVSAQLSLIQLRMRGKRSLKPCGFNMGGNSISHWSEQPVSALLHPRERTDETARGSNASTRSFSKRIGEGSATLAGAGLADPDRQGAFRSKCCS